MENKSHAGRAFSSPIPSRKGVPSARPENFHPPRLRQNVLLASLGISSRAMAQHTGPSAGSVPEENFRSTRARLAVRAAPRPTRTQFNSTRNRQRTQLPRATRRQQRPPGTGSAAARMAGSETPSVHMRHASGVPPDPSVRVAPAVLATKDISKKRSSRRVAALVRRGRMR